MVAPVYNEQEVLPAFYRRVVDALDGVIDFEIVLVNDGSSDGSIEILRQLAHDDSRVRVLSLSRNFGHQAAVTAGMDTARGQAVACIDADLQDPPELILEMVRLWRDGDDVVYGRRIDRTDQRRWKLFATGIYYRMVSWLSETPLPEQTGDFRLMDRKVVDALKLMREENRYLRGMVAWVGYQQRALDYNRDDRAAGESKYTVKKLFKLAFDGITSFSERPLKLATGLGLVVTALSFMYTMVIVVLYFADATNAPTGYTSLLGAILFLAGVQLLTIGVLGTYVGRIYRETKVRPLYLVAEELNSQEPSVTQQAASSAGASPVVVG